MGKSRVKGIVVEIGGDTIGLNKALDGTNKNISATESKLKDVERLLKLDPKNTVLLEQKQRLLKDAIAETNEKMNALNEANSQVKGARKDYEAWKAAYDPIQNQIDATSKKLKELKAQQAGMADCGEVDTDAYTALTAEVENASKELRELKKQAKEVSDQFGNPISPEQYNALQREIIETKSDLEKLTDSAKKNLEQMGDAVDDTKERMKRLGETASSVKDKADKVGDAFQPISTAAAGLAAAAVATVPATEDLREELSKLDNNAQMSCASVESARAAWKELALVSGDTGSAVEAVSNLLQAQFDDNNLERAVRGISDAVLTFPDTLSIESLADSLQETLATNEATGQFAELLERCGYDIDLVNNSLAECADRTEREDELLGLLASDLNGTYEAWRANNEEMLANKEANLELQESIAKLAEDILPIVTKVTKAIADFVEWFANLPEPAQAAIAAILAVVAAISPMASAVSDAAQLIEILSKTNLPGLSTAFGKLTGTVLPGVQGAFTSVFGFIAAHPVVLLIGAIAGLVALIGTHGDEVQAILQRVDDFLQGVFAKDWTEVFGPVLGTVLNGFMETLKGLWDGIYSILNGVIDFIRGIFTGDWERAWRGVVQIFEGIFQGLGTILKAPINTVIGMVNKAIDGINWLIEGVNKLPGVDIPTIGKQIPYLADGGEVLQGSAVVGEDGPELLTVLGDRTVVQPLSQTTTHTNHLGGVNVHVYGAPGQNVRELAEIVLEEIQEICDSEEAGL